MSCSFFILDKRIGSEENTHFDTNSVLKNVQLGLTLTNLFTTSRVTTTPTEFGPPCFILAQVLVTLQLISSP